MARTNARTGYCELCGVELKPGEGRLEFVPDADDNDDFDRVGTDREHAHWEVFCLNEADCKARVEATAQRHAAEQAEKKRVRDEVAAVKNAEKKAKQEAWTALTTGLERTDAQPTGWERTGEFFDSGLDVTCEKVKLPGGATGWYVSWIGDMDGCYWLVPVTVKESAEAEKARLHRVYQWWRPKGYGPDSYPGPGVPEDQLTEEERAEVARCWAAKYAHVEADWKRLVESAVKPQNYAINPTDPPRWSNGCEAWESLVAVGAEVEIVTDPESFKVFCRAYADSKLYSKERDVLKLTVTLRVKLPATAHNKNGSIKAAVEKKLPREWQTKTSNRFIEVRMEYV